MTAEIKCFFSAFTVKAISWVGWV